jgi:hypothetical protein
VVVVVVVAAAAVVCGGGFFFVGGRSGWGFSRPARFRDARYMREQARTHTRR